MPNLTKTQIAEAANIAWDILVQVATDKKSITYGGLLTAIKKTKNIQELELLNIGRPLDSIYGHCNSKKSVFTKETLPPLTVLVVSAQDILCNVINQDKPQCANCEEKLRRAGHPSIGYAEARKSIPEDSYAVYTHDWAKEPKPNFK